MALLDLVEYLDPTGNVLAARVPPDGSGELRLGSQCIVREGQLAFFVRDGRFLDMLIPGRHTLTTAKASGNRANGSSPIAPACGATASAAAAPGMTKMFLIQ